MEFPKVMPMQYSFALGDRFYVRECYPRYYDMVFEQFAKGKKAITITGTDGKATATVRCYAALTFCARSSYDIVSPSMAIMRM